MAIFQSSRRVSAVAGAVPLPWLHPATSPVPQALALPCIGQSLPESCLLSPTLAPGVHEWQNLPASRQPHLCSASMRQHNSLLRSFHRPLRHRERPEAPSPSLHYTGPPGPCWNSRWNWNSLPAACFLEQSSRGLEGVAVAGYLTDCGTTQKCKCCPAMDSKGGASFSIACVSRR